MAQNKRNPLQTMEPHDQQEMTPINKLQTSALDILDLPQPPQYNPRENLNRSYKEIFTPISRLTRLHRGPRPPRVESQKEKQKVSTPLSLTLEAEAAVATETDQKTQERQENKSPKGESLMSIEEVSSTFHPIIVIKINDVFVPALLDTGASLSICPERLASTFKAELEPITSQAFGVSGHPVHITALAKANIEIAGINRECPIFFTSNEVIDENQSYQFILGCDLFSLFPPFKLDITNSVLMIDGKTIAIGDLSKSMALEIPLRAEETFVIAPSTIKIVKARINANIRKKPVGFIIDQLD